MNKTTFILLITLIISYINTAYIQAQTQRVTVQGSILEKDTQFPVEQATIQLLSLPDSNYVKGISSLEQGKFSLTTLPGRFLLKNRHKAQRKAKFYINKCRSASCMQGGLKQASA